MRTAFFAWCVALLVAASPVAAEEMALCDAASSMVKQWVAADWGAKDDTMEKGFWNTGACTASGSGSLRTVRYAYSTPISRRNDTPPVGYTATVAYEAERDDYHLCKIDFGEGDVVKPSQHALCRE